MKRLETFIYVGVNRRADKTGIEQLLALEPDECAAILSRQQELPGQLADKLCAAGVGKATSDFLQPDGSTSAARAFAHWFAASVVLLQQAAGHDVSQFQLISSELPNRCRAWYEYEHSEVAHRAARLALQFIARLMPELELEEDLADEGGDDAALFAGFAEYAVKQVLPRDTQAIIDACARMDIPCTKLDREPYKGVSGKFRIRNHGLLMLGHSRYQQIVDGAVCIDRSDADLPLISDRDAIFIKLGQLGMPVATQDTQFRNCTTVGRAARSARKIGYPVVVKPMVRSHGVGVTLAVADSALLAVAVREAQKQGKRVIVEKFIPGETWKLIIAGGALTGVIAMASGKEVLAAAHEELNELAVKVSSVFNFGLMVMKIVSTDITRPLEHTGGAIVDLELAPKLDSFLPLGSKLLDQAAERFVRWIYPPDSISRIPIISITGTNGKTTTTRMVNRIMQEAGYHTGMTVTDGVYINGVLTEKGDLSGVVGHLRVFESTEVDCAVLETARGGLANKGLAFNSCNVALCTNISLDHLGDKGIHSLQQMADLKRTVMERARDAAVLNADDEYCRAMTPYLTAQTICLTSMKHDIAELQDRFPEARSFCVLEQVDGEECIVFHKVGGSSVMLKTKEIPAGYNGKMRVNIHNAMNAAAICHLMQIDTTHIRSVLKTFEMSYANTPGRLNVYDKLPFTVLADYAHNEDGVRAISEFVQSLDIKGKKIICFSVDGARSDDNMRASTIAAAGYFDLYVCKAYELRPEYIKPYAREELELCEFMKETLLAHGVPESQIVIIEEEQEAFEYVFKIAEPNDYAVLQLGDNALNTIDDDIRRYSNNYRQSRSRHDSGTQNDEL